MLKLIGNPFFPFVRKVSIALEYKELPYEVDPLNPISEKERLLKINSIGKVPVLAVQDSFVPESAVICKFLDSEKAENPLYPTDPKLKKQAEKIEEWADTVLAEAMGSNFFLQRIIKPCFLQLTPNEEKVTDTLNNIIPKLLTELEKVAPKTDFRLGEFSIADISVVNWIYCAEISGLKIEKVKYPKLSAYINRVYNTKAYKAVIAKEKDVKELIWAKKQYS